MRTDSPDNSLLRKIERAKPKKVSSDPSPQFQAEKMDLDRKAAEVQIESARQDIGERRKYAHRIFCMISAWLVVVALILIFQGIHRLVWQIPFDLPVPVLL